MREHMLIEIADGRKCLLTQDTGGDVRLTMLETFVAHKFACASVLLATFLALEAFLV